MKKALLSPIIVVFLLLATSTHAQEKTGQICFLRATGYVGSMVNYRVFINDSLVCKMKNKTYSMHTVPVGTHTIAASSAGYANNKKSDPLSVVVAEGKVTYIDVSWANKVFCNEITPNSAIAVLKRATKISNCQTAATQGE